MERDVTMRISYEYCADAHYCTASNPIYIKHIICCHRLKHYTQTIPNNISNTTNQRRYTYLGVAGRNHAYQHYYLQEFALREKGSCLCILYIYKVYLSISLQRSKVTTRVIMKDDNMPFSRRLMCV